MLFIKLFKLDPRFRGDDLKIALVLIIALIEKTSYLEFIAADIRSAPMSFSNFFQTGFIASTHA